MLGENLGVVKHIQKVGNDVLFLRIEEGNKIDVRIAILFNNRYGVAILSSSIRLRLLKTSMLF